MREFQEKKRFRRYLYSKGAVAILLVLVFFFGRASWGVYKKEQESGANAAQAQVSLKRLEDRQKILTDELNRLKTDEGIEEEIRSKFGVSKPGEQVVIIVEDKKATSTVPVPVPTWWEKVKGAF
ncbi:MAG: septum formation initiator family protein [bacterium]|nr:septum formation initiator family protein [bacterium]